LVSLIVASIVFVENARAGKPNTPAAEKFPPSVMVSGVPDGSYRAPLTAVVTAALASNRAFIALAMLAPLRVSFTVDVPRAAVTR
jgi:hypothetical protein